MTNVSKANTKRNPKPKPKQGNPTQKQNQPSLKATKLTETARHKKNSNRYKNKLNVQPLNNNQPLRKNLRKPRSLHLPRKTYKYERDKSNAQPKTRRQPVNHYKGANISQNQKCSLQPNLIHSYTVAEKKPQPKKMIKHSRQPFGRSSNVEKYIRSLPNKRKACTEQNQSCSPRRENPRLHQIMYTATLNHRSPKKSVRKDYPTPIT